MTTWFVVERDVAVPMRDGIVLRGLDVPRRRPPARCLAPLGLRSRGRRARQAGGTQRRTAGVARPSRRRAPRSLGAVPAAAADRPPRTRRAGPVLRRLAQTRH